ncbi:hypothetical protein PR048_024042 [Dryococelus australis]|uniref:Uncharacterized protein n=1 Tax=Dryococelus australis TaxID=614101 RepID=A0ABQ9GVS2_9NEOP|nr:hypothetical protein PR048_024042 [Dryococelus australis]
MVIEGAPTAYSGAGEPGSISGRVTPDFRTWESCRTTLLMGGFSRGSPVSPSPCIPALFQSHHISRSSAVKTSLRMICLHSPKPADCGTPWSWHEALPTLDLPGEVGRFYPRQVTQQHPRAHFRRTDPSNAAFRKPDYGPLDVRPRFRITDLFTEGAAQPLRFTLWTEVDVGSGGGEVPSLPPSSIVQATVGSAYGALVGKNSCRADGSGPVSIVAHTADSDSLLNHFFILSPTPFEA